MEAWAAFFAFVIGTVRVGFLANAEVPCKVMERRLVRSNRCEGGFVGNVCIPCLMFLRGLTDHPTSQAARNAMRRRKARDLTMRAQDLDKQLKGEEPS